MQSSQLCGLQQDVRGCLRAAVQLHRPLNQQQHLLIGVHWIHIAPYSIGLDLAVIPGSGRPEEWEGVQLQAHRRRIR